MTGAPHRGRRPNRALAWLLASAAGLVAAFRSDAYVLASPPAGDFVDNVAYGRVVSVPALDTLWLISNPVRAIVQPLEFLTLAPPRGASLFPGVAVTFAHRVTNLGNVSSDVRLDLTNRGGDDFDASPLAIVIDGNSDGVLGPGDSAFPSGGIFSLGAGEHRDLLVSATVPMTAAPGTVALVALDATSQDQGAVASLVDTLRVGATFSPPLLTFYVNDRYATPTRVASAGAPLHPEALAQACDLDPTARDTVSITLSARRTGDQETFVAVETDVHTGRFRILPSVPTARAAPLSGGQLAGVVEVASDDEVTATLRGCGAVETRAGVWIDPEGVVFDSRSDRRVAGARVTLVDETGAGNGGDAGGPARVFSTDGVSAAPSTVVTDASGRYVFPWVPASTYRVEVVPPQDYRFPSSMDSTALPSGHAIDPRASYGASFWVDTPGTPVSFDVPVDATATYVLFTEKDVSRSVAEIGDALDYKVRVTNRSDSTAAALAVFDRLPAGFAYLRGTARRDDAPIEDPMGGAGPLLRFELGTLAANSVATLRYRVRLHPGVVRGEATNQAWAAAGSSVSNVATARVTVTGGVFAEEGMILGTVYLDRDGDHRFGLADVGVPGVRLYLDDGTFVVTDPDGQFSFYGVVPRTHALKVDPGSLPEGAKLETLAHRQSTRPGVRFVDVQRGDLHRADFAIVGDSATVAATLRRRAAAGRTDDAEHGLRRTLPVSDDPATFGDPRARPSAGVIGEGTPLPLFGGALVQEGTASRVPSDAGRTLDARLAASDAPDPVTPVAPESVSTRAARERQAMEDLPPLASLVGSLDPRLGFVGLAEGDTIPRSQLRVRVKGLAGLPFALQVNGASIPSSRVGTRVVAPNHSVEAWEYIGVGLGPGQNVLEVSQLGPGDLPVARARITVVAPDRVGHLEVLAPRAVPADGHSMALVRVRWRDTSGLDVAGRRIVTLETTAGVWRADDLDPDCPGVQVALDGGEAAVRLEAPPEPGAAVIRATADGSAAEAALDFEPELRPLLLVGTAEAIVTWHHLRRGMNPAVESGFEEPITNYRADCADGGASAEARAALFVKGRLRHDVLLTLGYDSEKPSALRQFRDIQPDRFYPVYGDGSVRGYEARSTGRLFGRLDRRGASLLYGDFVTPAAGSSRRLATYSRSLTGVRQHYEGQRVRVDAFTSRSRSRQRVDELPGLGVSGPYLLQAAPLVENSERVEILVRDKDHPSVILSATERTRFSDYAVEPLTGRLLFSQPVPSLDAQLNPVSIRVSYELRDGGEPYWVSGVEVHVKPTTAVEIGGSYVEDHDPVAPYELRSASVAFGVGSHATLETEYAVTRRLRGASGDGIRLELRHQGTSTQSRFYAAVTDSGFDNPNAGYGPGRAEAGLRLSARVSDRTRMIADGLFTADRGAGERRGGLLVGVDQRISRLLGGEFGLRVQDEKRRDGSDPRALVSLRARLLAQMPQHPELSGYTEYEQDLVESDRRLVALGGEYRFRARARAYARHELASTFAGPFSLDVGRTRLASVIGIDADVAHDAHVFSEYRLPDALAAREAEAAVGLRNAWRLGDGSRLGFSYERVSPLRGGGAGPTTAVTASIENPSDAAVKASGRLEIRTARTGDSFLSTMATAWRVDSAWTALGRNLASYTDDRARGVTIRERFQLGVAYRRPDVDTWAVLARYELHYDRGALEPTLTHRRTANVLSLHTAGSLLDRVDASLAWAVKVASEDDLGRAGGSHAQWLHARWSRDLGRSWDAGLSTSALFGDGGSRRDGLGVELGRDLGNGMWLSLGWNRFGYEDPDLPTEEYTRAGLYLRLRARFDESLLHAIGGGRP